MPRTWTPDGNYAQNLAYRQIKPERPRVPRAERRAAAKTKTPKPLRAPPPLKPRETERRQQLARIAARRSSAEGASHD